jgi:hypothetical protein
VEIYFPVVEEVLAEVPKRLQEPVDLTFSPILDSVNDVLDHRGFRDLTQ